MIIPCCVCVRALKVLQKSMMLTPCWPSAGPTGGAGVACPAGICSLTWPMIFFAMLASRSRLQPSGPAEVQLDRRLPAEDGHHHLQRAAVEVDLVDHAGEVVERPVDDLDRSRPSRTRASASASPWPSPPARRSGRPPPAVSGVGFLPVPTKPVTFGVFLTTCQVSSDISISTRCSRGRTCAASPLLAALALDDGLGRDADLAEASPMPSASARCAASPSPAPRSRSRCGRCTTCARPCAASAASPTSGRHEPNTSKTGQSLADQDVGDRQVDRDQEAGDHDHRGRADHLVARREAHLAQLRPDLPEEGHASAPTCPP